MESTKLLISSVIVRIIMVQYAGTSSSSCSTCQRDPIQMVRTEHADCQESSEAIRTGLEGGGVVKSKQI